jgi:hypothetical protein
MSKASAYGDEIWQVHSLPQNADRMFISLKGFSSGGLKTRKVPVVVPCRLPLNKYTP